MDLVIPESMETFIVSKIIRCIETSMHADARSYVPSDHED